MVRFKRLFGGRLWARDLEPQRTDVVVKGAVLNRMTQLGMPETVRVFSSQWSQWRTGGDVPHYATTPVYNTTRLSTPITCLTPPLWGVFSDVQGFA